ncbi:hypothetical protein [Citrobacter braakii]|uniref:hypothetical protein n=1 Tax=Citrobacter braakii TaxID=57706 RepID=UPI00397BA7CC
MSMTTFKNKKSKTEQQKIKELLKSLLPHLPHLSLLSAVIGFINIWIYLSRIGKLNLLPSFLASPSTLLAIFASMCLILILFLLFILMPTIIFYWLCAISKDKDSKITIYQTITIGLLLSIIGSTDVLYTTGFFIFITAFYICYFLYTALHNKLKINIFALIKGFIINIPTFIIISIIYNNTALSGIDRLAKILILFVYLIIIYMPLIACDGILNKQKGRKKESAARIITTIIIISIYFISVMTPGILIKLNNYTISFSGLRSDIMFWYKINKNNFPSEWLKNNWGIKETSQNEIWIQGYPVVQNNNFTFVCPERTHKLMNEYVNTRLNSFVKEKSGSMDTGNCILIQNNLETSMKVTDVKNNR